MISWIVKRNTDSFNFPMSPYPEDLNLPLGSFGVPNAGASVW